MQRNRECCPLGQCVEFGSVRSSQGCGDHSNFHLLEITALLAVADNLNQKRQAGLSAWLFCCIGAAYPTFHDRRRIGRPAVCAHRASKPVAVKMTSNHKKELPIRLYEVQRKST